MQEDILSRPMSKKSQADQVIDLFSGLRPLARALNHTSPSTVQGWRICGQIPSWRHDEILRAARKAKVKKADVLKALNGG